MAGDNLQVVPVAANHLGGLLGDELVAGAVEAVAADAVFLIHLVGQAIEEALGRQGAVEGGVEDGRLGDAGQHLAHGIDTGQVAGGVQRGQVLEALNLLDNLVVDQHATFEDLAAVGHTVTNGTNLLEVLDNTNLRVSQRLEDNLDTLGMVGDGQLLVVLLAVPLVGELAHFQTNTLQQALGHDVGIVCHVDKLILDRRTSAV